MGLLDGKLDRALKAAIKTASASILYRRLTEGTYSTATQTMTPSEPAWSPYTMTVAWWGAASPLPRDGTVQPGDRFCLIRSGAVSGFTPRKGDVVEFSTESPNVQYRVIDLVPYATGDQVAGWQAQLRIGG